MGVKRGLFKSCIAILKILIHAHSLVFLQYLFQSIKVKNNFSIVHIYISIVNTYVDI